MKKRNIESKSKRKIHFFPKTKLGKWSFWLVIVGIIIVFGLYWSSMLIDAKNTICDSQGICQPTPGSLSANSIFIIFTRIIPSLLAMACVVIAGITSLISIFKYKDYAIFLFISALIGILGILFVLGEFIFPH